MTSDCSTPSFCGNFLPTERNVGDNGFDAEWKVLAINRSFSQIVTDSKWRDMGKERYAYLEGDDSETLLAGIVFGDMEEDPSSTVEVVLGKGNPVGVAGEAPRCIDGVVDAEQQRVVAAIAAHEEERVTGPHTVVRH